MAATCSFGISFGFGTVTGSDSEASTRNWVHEQSSIAATANHNSNNNDNDKNNNINANAFQYDDGLCPYSDEKEVVVEGGNFAEQTIWRSTATSQDHIVHEDSNSTVTAGSQGPSATQKITSALPPISKLPCIRVWRLTKNAVKNASSSTSKYLTVSMPHESNQAGRSLEFSVISRKEFEALPLTIQRKHFSTLERLRLARDLGGNDTQDLDTASSPLVFVPTTARAVTAPSSSGRDQKSHRRPTHRSSTESKSCDIDSRHHPRLSSLDQELLTRLPDKVKRQHLSREEQLLAQHQQFIACHRHPPGVVDDGEKERPIRHKRLHHLDLAEILESNSIDSVVIASDMPIHELSSAQHPGELGDMDVSEFYDTIRWLEQDGNLDLRLCLDDPSQGMPAKPQSQYSERPSLRRHLSLSSKLPFARTTTSNHSRPTTNNTTSVPQQAPTTPSHVRNKSRALSLMSPNKHTRQDSSMTLDLAAAHYKDPEARLRLRNYLATPQKFDEAIEFGFPSVDGEKENQPSGNQEPEEDPIDQLRTWLNDDRSSIYSDKSSIADPESPKTPPIMDRATPMQPFRVPIERSFSSRGDLEQMPMREMTLRMTLTRPDLRAGESEIYGWQQQNVQMGRPHHVRQESSGPGSTSRQMTPKASIERQFLSMDQEADHSYENGTLKRFWKRVRRT